MIAPRTPQLLLADPDPASRGRLASLLSNGFPDARTTATRSFEDLLDHLENHSIDVVIAAFQIEGHSILQVIEKASVANLPTRFLIFSDLDETQAGVPSIRMGGSGFIGKHAPASDFVVAVRSVLMGRFFLSDSLMKALASEGGPTNAQAPGIEVAGKPSAENRPQTTQTRPSHGGSSIQIPTRGAAMRWSDSLSIPF